MRHDVSMQVNADNFRAWNDTGYPRPQLCRESWTSLDGRWEFAADPKDQGIKNGWFRPGEAFSGEINVPFPIGSELSGQAGTEADVNWYRRLVSAVEIAGAGKGPKIALHFEAVDFLADVWIDGQHCAQHSGGYSPFTVIVDRPEPGRNLCVVVRTEDSCTDISKPRGKQDWRNEPHGIWYHQSRGIWRDVWIEALPQNFVASVQWNSNIDTGTVSAKIRLQRPPTVLASVSVQLSLAGKILARCETLVIEGEATVPIEIPALRNRHEWDEFLWSPEIPNLVDALIVYREDESVDTVISYLGIRQVSLDRRYLAINRVPIFVRGVLDQGYWPKSYFTAPSAEDYRRDLSLAQQMGFNTVRVHERSADRKFLAWADRMGIMVWAESASAYGFDAVAIERTMSEWVALVERDKSHPSIVAWVPFNESWGVSSIAARPEQGHFVDSVVSVTRALDSSRPVIANDGWEQRDTDIVSTHDYATTGRELVASYADVSSIAETVHGTGPQGRQTLLAGSWSDDRPVMVTEFGGISLNESDSGSWGYGVVADKEEFQLRLQELFASLYQSPILGGFCYTQLTDTGAETNGLCDASRTPKLPIEVLRKIVCGDDPHREHVRPRKVNEVSAALPAKREQR